MDSEGFTLKIAGAGSEYGVNEYGNFLIGAGMGINKGCKGLWIFFHHSVFHSVYRRSGKAPPSAVSVSHRSLRKLQGNE